MVVTVDTIFVGYSTFLADENVMKANGSCTLVRDSYTNVLVDTMTAWDKDYLIKELENLQLSCDDIHYVVCTHGHSDHIGNLNLFTKAMHIVGFSLSHGEEYISHPFQQGIPYNISENIEVIPTPGHTLSDVSVVVRNTEKGVIVIAGDLFEHQDDIRNPDIWKITAGSENPVEQYRNRKTVLSLANFIVPGHGPMFEVTDDLRQLHVKTTEDFVKGK